MADPPRPDRIDGHHHQVEAETFSEDETVSESTNEVPATIDVTQPPMTSPSFDQLQLHDDVTAAAPSEPQDGSSRTPDQPAADANVEGDARGSRSIPRHMSWRFPLTSPRSSPQETDAEGQTDNDGDQQPTPNRRKERLKRSLSSLRGTSFKGGVETKSSVGKKPDAIKEDDEDGEEDTAEQIAARKLEQRLRQAKKLEQFFIRTDAPPRPVLERSRYDHRDWSFDPDNDWLDRSSNYNFFTLKRPFFAAFHIAWIAFFFCFMGWFAIGPLVPVLLRAGFTKEAIETSNALALASTIIIRFILGPYCEIYGPRLVMTTILAVGGMLVCATAGVTNAAGLMVARFFIGLIGGAFVPCQFWMSMMFSTKIVGFMSGSAAGFGNAGAGVIVFVMGGLISAFQGAGYTSDQTWRYSLLVPGFMMIACAVPTYFLPADCPQGPWKDRKYGTPADKIGRMAWLRRGGSAQMKRVLQLEQRIGGARWRVGRWWYRLQLFFRTEEKFSAFWDWRAWMVGIQYSVASGVELSILTGLTAYYAFEFGCEGDVSKQLDQKALLLNGSINSTCLDLDTSTAAYVSAIFGLTNLYGRMLGGGLSDYIASTRTIFRGVRGRHLAIFITLLLQGVTMMVWCLITDWRASAGFMVLFSSVVHMAKGAVIAVAPFVRPGSVGPVMGVVSAVGNLGGVLMSLMYSAFRTSREVFYWQAVICLVGSLSAFTLRVHDLEKNADVWLLSLPSKKSNEAEDVEDDEGNRKMGRTLTSKFISLRRPRKHSAAREDDEPHENDSSPQQIPATVTPIDSITDSSTLLEATHDIDSDSDRKDGKDKVLRDQVSSLALV